MEYTEYRVAGAPDALTGRVDTVDSVEERTLLRRAQSSMVESLTKPPRLRASALLNVSEAVKGRLPSDHEPWTTSQLNSLPCEDCRTDCFELLQGLAGIGGLDRDSTRQIAEY